MRAILVIDERLLSPRSLPCAIRPSSCPRPDSPRALSLPNTSDPRLRRPPRTCRTTSSLESSREAPNPCLVRMPLVRGGDSTPGAGWTRSVLAQHEPGSYLARTAARYTRVIRAVPCNGYDRLEGLRRVLACRHRGRNWQDQSPIVTKYAELRLRIDRGVGRGSYRIVATGPAGEALGRFKLPFSELELENFILKVGAHPARPSTHRFARDGPGQDVRDEALRCPVRGRRSRAVPLVVL